MSSETAEWLNNNVLVGFTAKRGHAWHYKASEQGAESNHYEGAIPVADVVRRLFNFHCESLPVFVAVPCDLAEAHAIGDDGRAIKYVRLDNRQAMAADDNHHVFELFKGGYVGHDYDQWLLGNVANLLGGEVGIGSAGLLRERAIAWVSVEVPENVVTPEGVVFRPHLLATTSFDGSIATTYKRVQTFTVCDNTRENALGERSEQVKVKHSKYSQLRLEEAQDALNLLADIADDTSAEIKTLCEWEVTDGQWAKLLDKLVPVDGGDSKRAATLTLNKRSALSSLYNHDERAATWHGTAFGVLQAFNTWGQHIQTVQGAERPERNMINVLGGRTAKADSAVLAALQTV